MKGRAHDDEGIGRRQILRMHVGEPLPEILAKEDYVRFHQAPTPVTLCRHVPQDVGQNSLRVMSALAVDARTCVEASVSFDQRVARHAGLALKAVDVLRVAAQQLAAGMQVCDEAVCLRRARSCSVIGPELGRYLAERRRVGAEVWR